VVIADDSCPPSRAVTSHLVTQTPVMSRFGPSDQWLAALSSLVTVRGLISYSDHEVAPVSSLVTAPRLRPVFANNRGSGRATPARGPRAARRRSTRGFRAFEAIVAGSIACSPPDTRARNSISAGAARGGHGQITSGSTGIDVVGSRSLGSGPPGLQSCPEALRHPYAVIPIADFIIIDASTAS
jgi:hypothetical protein